MVFVVFNSWLWQNFNKTKIPNIIRMPTQTSFNKICFVTDNQTFRLALSAVTKRLIFNNYHLSCINLILVILSSYLKPWKHFIDGRSNKLGSAMSLKGISIIDVLRVDAQTLSFCVGNRRTSLYRQELETLLSQIMQYKF